MENREDAVNGGRRMAWRLAGSGALALLLMAGCKIGRAHV